MRGLRALQPAVARRLQRKSAPVPIVGHRRRASRPCVRVAIGLDRFPLGIACLCAYLVQCEPCAAPSLGGFTAPRLQWCARVPRLQRRRPRRLRVSSLSLWSALGLSAALAVPVVSGRVGLNVRRVAEHWVSHTSGGLMEAAVVRVALVHYFVRRRLVRLSVSEGRPTRALLAKRALGRPAPDSCAAPVAAPPILREEWVPCRGRSEKHQSASLSPRRRAARALLS